MPNKMIAIVLLIIAATTPSIAQEASPRTYWSHNGSIMYLVAKGATREFYYHEPRSGILQAGAREGSILFSGRAIDQSYFGTAFIYNSRCGHIPYQVSGPILDNYKRVVLQGQAPRIGANCRITGYIADTLEFSLIKPDEVRAVQPVPTGTFLKAFQGTWTDKNGICQVNMEKDMASSSAVIYTISNDEITRWFYYSLASKKNRSYGICDAEHGRISSLGEVIVDLDCDHPGHSKKSGKFSRINNDRIKTPFGILHRCN